MNEPIPHRLETDRTLVILFLSLLSFIFIAFLVYREGVTPFDRMVAALVKEHMVSPKNTRFFFNISYLGSTGFLFPAYLLVFAFCIIRRKFLQGFVLGVSGASVFLLSNGLKELFHRARPLDPLVHAPTTWSFPSGHSSSGMTYYVLCAFLILQLNIPIILRNLFAFILILLALVIGFSRIYLGLHYVTDVLGGFTLSFFWLASMHLFYQQLQPGRLTNFASFLGQDRKL